MISIASNGAPIEILGRSISITLQGTPVTSDSFQKTTRANGYFDYFPSVSSTTSIGKSLSWLLCFFDEMSSEDFLARQYDVTFTLLNKEAKIGSMHTALIKNHPFLVFEQSSPLLQVPIGKGHWNNSFKTAHFLENVIAGEYLKTLDLLLPVQGVSRVPHYSRGINVAPSIEVDGRKNKKAISIPAKSLSGAYASVRASGMLQDHLREALSRGWLEKHTDESGNNHYYRLTAIKGFSWHP